MFRKGVSVLIVLGSSLTVFAKDLQSRTCQVHVAMSGESTLPAHLRLQVFNDSQSVLDREVPLDGTLELSELPIGEYRLQVHAASPSLLSAGRLHVTEDGPCRGDISITARADSKNQFVEEDVDVEDLRVSRKTRSVFQNAFMEFQRGDLNRAKQGFLEVIKLDPKLARAYNSLGVISDQQGDKKAAREYFEKALELNPVNKSSLLNFAKLTATQNDYSTSIGLFERYLAGSPEIADVHVMEADVYLKMGDFQNAIRQANKVHALSHANWAIIHVLAAQAYQGLHETEKAVLEYQQYAAECSSDALRQEAAARIRALTNGSPQELPAPSASFAFH
jgi:Flp pilus assembly protein TadD